MERKEKVVEREGKYKGKKQEEELKDGKRKVKGGMIMVGKRGGPSTPSPTWRLEFSSPNDNNNNNTNHIQEFLNTTTTVSARKLCANLWEIQPQPKFLLSKMSKNTGRREAGHGHHKDKKAFDSPTHLVGPSTSNRPFEQPDSASALRRHGASFMQHHRSVKRNGHALRPISPASPGSSMEVAPYNQEVSPTSSLDFKGKMGESSYSLKTSTELLKVLNRIWSLEEQQASNLSLLKALKMELDHSRSQIKELLKEKQTNRREMEDLMKQVAEDKVIRKTMEQDRIKATIQSAREELEDERKLRKHSESLHRKLARELSEVKSSFSHALKELEREMKARILLENLCDEFATGIREYEQEVRSLRKKLGTDHVGRDKPNRLVLHISEAWLDERMQMKLAEGQNNLAAKNTIVDKLSLDIETFLQARHSIGSRKDDTLSANEAINNMSRRESFPLNEVASAPQDAADEGDSTDSDSRCFELRRSVGKKQSIGSSKQQGDGASESHLEEIVNSNSTKKMAGSRENGKVVNLAGLQTQFEEHMARNKNAFPDREQDESNQGAIGNSGISNIYEDAEEGLHGRTGRRVGTCGFSSSHVLDNLIRNHSFSSEGDKIHPEGDLKEDSCVQPAFTSPASPVQQWTSNLMSPEFEKSESSLKLPKGFKEHTLKAKLLEARLESQKYRSKAAKPSI